MNIVGVPRLNSSLNKGIGGIGTVAETNAYELNFYANPPSYELSLDEFEQFALARLKVNDLYRYSYLSHVIHSHSYTCTYLPHLSLSL